MTQFAIYQATAPQIPCFISEDPVEIASQLEAIGVIFERWPLKPIADQNTQEDIIALYQNEINQLRSKLDFKQIDVVHLRQNPTDPNIRQKFLEEHTHSENEIRYFVAGAGLFYLHLQDKVYAIGCEAGDLLSVPADTKHWFDAGNPATLSCIRFFERPDGWVASYTEDKIATHYPLQENPLRVKAIVTDIEGTLTPIDFVRNILFPYAATQLGRYLQANEQALTASGLLDELRQAMGNGHENASLTTIDQHCQQWIKDDLKITALKNLQGLIWEEGYRTKAFTSPVYADAAAALIRWWQNRISLYCYSSGSIYAQKLLYRHTEHGNLLPVFKNLFDTTTGPKKSLESYQKIAEHLALPPNEILFLSDDYEELIAAESAGMACCQLVRPKTPIKAYKVQAEDFNAVEALFKK